MGKKRAHTHTMNAKQLALFDQFWEAYPRKEGKGAARAAFEKAITLTDINTMLGTLAWQSKSEAWMEGFAPHGATWLNQERWDDQPMAPTLNKKNARALRAIFGDDPEF